MSAVTRAAAAISILALPLTASAFGLRSSSRTTTSYSYYPAPVVWVAAYYVPVYCVPVMTAAVPLPPPAPPSRFYATPTAAPPLASPAGAPPAAPPPGQPPMPPAVGEQRTSYYDAYALAGREGQPVDGERCSVGFWNTTDRDLVLRVAGQVRSLPRGAGITLTLPREFTWQLDGREVKQEQVAVKESGVEIVIRR